MEKRPSLLLIVLAVILFSYGVGAETPTDPKKLFQSTCSQCHSLDVPRGERLTRDEWTTIVERMKTNGCVISGAETKIIIDYLTKEYGK